MKSFRAESKLDHIGMTASLLCAVHCAVVPFVIASLPLLGISFLASPWVEWGMILFALIVGVYAIGFSYLRKHHKALPVILLITDFLIIIAGHLFISAKYEGLVVPSGGLFIVMAHFFNYKYISVLQKGQTIIHAGHIHYYR